MTWGRPQPRWGPGPSRSCAPPSGRWPSSTGDELVSAGNLPVDYQIADMNSGMLAALIVRDGGEPRVIGPLPDDRNRIRAEVAEAALLGRCRARFGRNLDRPRGPHPWNASPSWASWPSTAWPSARLGSAGLRLPRRSGRCTSPRQPRQLPSALTTFIAGPIVRIQLADPDTGPILRRLSLDRPLDSSAGRVDYVRVKVEQGRWSRWRPVGPRTCRAPPARGFRRRAGRVGGVSRRGTSDGLALRPVPPRMVDETPKPPQVGHSLLPIPLLWLRDQTMRGALVLCGGESRRMGQPKAWLAFGPERLLQRVVRIASEAADQVVVVAAGGKNAPLPDSVRIVRDPVSGRGPLQGLAAGLSVLPNAVETVFATATDAPFLRPTWIDLLHEAIGSHGPGDSDRRRFSSALVRRFPAFDHPTRDRRLIEPGSPSGARPHGYFADSSPRRNQAPRRRSQARLKRAT